MRRTNGLLSPPRDAAAVYPLSSGLSTLPNIQGVGGNNIYALPDNLEPMWLEDFSVIEFPRENLNFIERIGEGAFGDVRRIVKPQFHSLYNAWTVSLQFGAIRSRNTET